MTHCHVEVRSLELTRAHDGLFRGAPEPVFLIALYGVGSEQTAPLRVDRVAFSVNSESPKTLHWTGDGWRGAAVGPVGCVVVAMEEDGGDDIARLETLLGESAPWIWCLDAEPATRRSLEEVGPDVQRADLEGATGAWSTSCNWDKWVGAAAWIESAPHAAAERVVHVRSALGRNDWTLRLTTAVE